MKALGPDSWGLAPARPCDMEEARARGVQVFADQYPYEASSTSLRAALAPGGAEPTEASSRENLRRRGNGPDAILIASLPADPIAGRQDADGDREGARRRRRSRRRSR